MPVPRDRSGSYAFSSAAWATSGAVGHENLPVVVPLDGQHIVLGVALDVIRTAKRGDRPGILLSYCCGNAKKPAGGPGNMAVASHGERHVDAKDRRSGPDDLGDPRAMARDDPGVPAPSDAVCRLHGFALSYRNRRLRRAWGGRRAVPGRTQDGGAAMTVLRREEPTGAAASRRSCAACWQRFRPSPKR